MLKKINPKDLRTLKLGAAGIVAVFVLLFILDFKERWAAVKESFDAVNNRLAVLSSVNMTDAQYAGLLNNVPVFEMPQEKEKQKFLFQDSLNEQLKKANITSQPWQELAGRSKLLTGHKLLLLKSSSKCNITQLFDLLVNLKENPYLVSIEEITVKRDAKNKQQADIDLTVSTPVKKE
jgi:hypothetical protein